MESKNPKEKMTIAEAIAVSVNVSLKECITGDEIVEILRSGILPVNRIPHIGIMFAEVQPSEIAELLTVYNITLAETQKLYSVTPDFYHTSRMEDFLYGDLGNIA